jgi:hypothetical protein
MPKPELPIIKLPQTDAPDYRFLGEAVMRYPDYDATEADLVEFPVVCELFVTLDSGYVIWLNIEGMKKAHPFPDARAAAKYLDDSIRARGHFMQERVRDILKYLYVQVRRDLRDAQDRQRLQ